MKRDQRFGLITQGTVFNKAWKKIDNTYDKEEQEHYDEYLDGELDDFPSYNGPKGND